MRRNAFLTILMSFETYMRSDLIRILNTNIWVQLRCPGCSHFKIIIWKTNVYFYLNDFLLHRRRFLVYWQGFFDSYHFFQFILLFFRRWIWNGNNLDIQFRTHELIPSYSLRLSVCFELKDCEITTQYFYSQSKMSV